MKKTTALFSIIFLSIATYAQSNFQLGLRFSPNIGWIKPDVENVENEGMKLGFNYGIIADFNIADNYSFSTGLTLTQTGGEVTMPDVRKLELNGVSSFAYGQTTADIRLNYIEVPLTLKLKTNEIGYMKYFGQFGLGVNFNYKARADLKFKYNNSNNEAVTIPSDDVDYSDEINLFRLSLIAGLGAEYNLSGNTSIVMGVTFNNGFTNIFSEDTYLADGNGNAIDDGQGGKKSEDLKAINNFVLLNIGIIF